MSDVSNRVMAAARLGPAGANWGGKALLVFALALLMAVPGLFVCGLVAERTHRANVVVDEVSALQGGPQSVLGPQLVAPYAAPDDKGVMRAAGWYVVSPDRGQAAVRVKTAALHRGIFNVPVYHASVDLTADFGARPTALDLPAGAVVDWSRALVVLGFSDLRGAQADVTASFTENGHATPLAFAPAPGVRLGGPSGDGAIPPPGVFGLVAAPGAALVATKGGVLTSHLEFTGAQRISVMPFAKSTTASIAGDWPAPSFDGGFLPGAQTVSPSAFTASWSVPFMARGLAAHGTSDTLSLSQLASNGFGVSFVRTNNPYENVTRALKYAIMFVGLVFLSFFVFEALSGRRLHPAQYLLIGLAQMVFYLLLLSLAEYVGFDGAFAIAASATVILIGVYAGAVFRSRAYGARALVVFSLVYGLSYLLMRLADFALLAGSVASFIGLAAAMYLTRNIDWYGKRPEGALPATPDHIPAINP